MVESTSSNPFEFRSCESRSPLIEVQVSWVQPGLVQVGWIPSVNSVHEQDSFSLTSQVITIQTMIWQHRIYTWVLISMNLKWTWEGQKKACNSKKSTSSDWSEIYKNEAIMQKKSMKLTKLHLFSSNYDKYQLEVLLKKMLQWKW